MKSRYEHCQKIIDTAWELVRALEDFKEFRLSKMSGANQKNAIEMMRAIISPVHGLIDWASRRMMDADE